MNRRVRTIFLAQFLLGLFIWVFGGFSHSHAASCCAAASSNLNLISGDEQVRAQTAFGARSIIGDALSVDSDRVPIFRAEDDSEWTLNQRFDLAAVIAEQWQLFGSFSIERRSRQTPEVQSSHLGFGDLSLGSAYEILPEYTYSVWKPKVFLFATLTVPTARSIDQATQLFMVDSHGRGFWVPSFGAFAVKNFNSGFGVQTSAMVQVPMPRSGLARGVGLLLMAGAKYSFSTIPLDISASIAPNFEFSIVKQSIDTLLSAQWRFSNEWQAQIAYMDQTLLGPAINTELSRGFSVSVSWLGLR